MTDLSLFDYPLPSELIAQRPAPTRDGARLMTLDRATGGIAHKSFVDLPDLLRPDDLLVLNTTQVIPARLRAKRATGGAVELLLARRIGDGAYEAMARPMARLNEGERLTVGDDIPVVFARRLDGGLCLIRFGDDETAVRAARTVGDVPLPPYIRRPQGRADDDDRERYQTLFADQPGSCAAPTAGLHFTQAILDRIGARGIERATVTLHVGPGTFRPVSVADIEEHRMDAENYEISEAAAEAVNAAKRAGRRIVAVGSTATRALESAADATGIVRPGANETRLYITPGYRFRVVDGIVTNFHLPKSTLLILVAAFAGREATLAAYEAAVREKYRFFSYGDAMFIA
jgi:S-adenosylmethionine:tRNA ribosyltransferase-isomerase